MCTFGPLHMLHPSVCVSRSNFQAHFSVDEIVTAVNSHSLKLLHVHVCALACKCVINSICVLDCVQGHPNPEHFLWEEYLQDNGSTAVPSQAFCMVSNRHGTAG